MRRYSGRAVLALAALTVASAATLTVPVAVRRMIDFGFRPDRAGLINAYFLGLLGLMGVLALAAGALGERIVADLRESLFTHLSGLDATFFDDAQTGELMSRLTADTAQIKAAFGSSASVALRNLFMFLGAVIMMVVSAPKLSVFVPVAIPHRAAARLFRPSGRAPRACRPRHACNRHGIRG